MLAHDRDVLRRLASRWMTLATHPVMEERKRLWTLKNDLRAERPMVLFETGALENYVTDDELQCDEPGNRGLEKWMRWQIRHTEEVGDDIVLPPYHTIGWHVSISNYGVAIPTSHATDTSGVSLGYTYEHPIKTPDDLDLLKPRTCTVDRESTQRQCEQMTDLFGDIMPVEIGGFQWFLPSMTSDPYRLIGNENLLMWGYDEPEALHRLMAYIRDDRQAILRWLEREGLLGLNNNADGFIGGTLCFTSDLPKADFAGTARLRDIWTWVESQETVMVSPDMFAEFFLPYIADVANDFGLVYYGCCEPVQDRWSRIARAIPNIRAVSISMWNDQYVMGETLGKEYVYSRKPKAAPISGETPDWEVLREDLEATLDAARDCNLEFIFRDVYRIHGDRARLRQWVEMVRAHIGGAMLDPTTA